MTRAYGLRIAIFAIVGLLAGLVMTFTMSPKYEGVIQVLVDQSGTTNARMMTNAEESVRDLLESPRPRTVATQVEQMTGFGVLGRASMAVHAKRGLPLGSIKELDLMDLQNSLSVEAANTSDIITLRTRMPDKELAKDVLNEIYLAFDAQNQEASRDVGSRALVFLESQTKQVKAELEAVDAKIETLRRQYGAPAVDLQVQSEIQTLRVLDESLEQARMEYAASTAQVATLRDQLKSVKPVIQSSQSIGVNSNYQRLEAALADAQTERAQLLTQWQKGSPAIKTVDEKVKNLEAALKKANPEINAGRQTSTNPLYQNLSNEIAQAQGRVSAAQQRVAAATIAVNAKRQLLTRLPEVQRKVEDLRRQQESLTRTYMQYKDSLDSLQVAQRGRVTQSTLVSPAFVNPMPVSPNMPLNLAAGLLAGLLLGVLTSFHSESKKSPIRNLTQLNRLAFEPSFRTIPELPVATPTLARMPDDAYVALLGNFIRSDRKPYRLGVMGIDVGSGATTTATSLAIAAALENRNTLLVDTDDKNGGSHRLGLTGSTPSEASSHLTVFKAVGESTSETGRMVEEIRMLEQDRDLCVYDLQPYKSSGNPLMLASSLDECILLVRAGRTRSVDFLQAQQMLSDAGVRIVTVVLSRTRRLDDDFSFVDSEAPALVAR
jgi:uncharacterized protein involved in exopolysaccharide biosynthesis